MKPTLMIILAGIFLAGCAMEAPYVDHEFGQATKEAFERQIVHKTSPYANRPVEGLDGIHAESVMDTYHGTFSEGFTGEDIDIMSIESN